MTNLSEPPLWGKDQLVRDAQISLEEFVWRRLAEPGGKYIQHVTGRRAPIIRLFKALKGVDPEKPDPETISKILLDEQLFDALRYVAGPPVSFDDLGVLVTRSIKGISKTSLENGDLAVDVLKLICRLADPFRFPWIESRRAPTRQEIKTAILATAVMHGTQSLQTERRSFGKEVERRLVERLIELKFVKITPKNAQECGIKFPPKARIIQPSHHPVYPHFFGECVVYGRKVDLCIALATGKIIAVEAKDSSSALNSTKRLLNDTAAKAKQYAAAGGQNIVSVALLSGVFSVENLEAAQKSGLYLVWAHRMDEFIDWIKSQT